jgi:hypothetical protein
MSGSLKTIYYRKDYARWLSLELCGTQFEVELTWSPPTKPRGAFHNPEDDDGYLSIDGIYIAHGKLLSPNLWDYLNDWCKASLEEKAWERLLADEEEKDYEVVPW